MKKFFAIDFWVQLLVLASISSLVLIPKFTQINIRIEPVLFYFGVGGMQLISFLIRVFFKYKKNLLYKIYGIVILNIWFSFLGLFMFGNINSISSIFLSIAILGYFISPFFAIIYVYYCYSTMKNL